MGSKCELSSTIHVAKWETTPRRPQLEINASTIAPGRLRPPPGANCASGVHKPSLYLADLPSTELMKPESVQHLGGKILKLLKLRKKSSSVVATTTFLCQEASRPSLRTFRFEDTQSSSKQFPVAEDVTERYNYDSDEHSGSVASGSSGDQLDTPISSSASASSSSSSSSSAQSFRSTPRNSFVSTGHQPSSQLMANILISISHMDEDDGANEDIGYRDDHQPASLNGPHESAWHQPLDEFKCAEYSLARGRLTPSKPSSGRNTPNHGRLSIDHRLTSPGPSRRYGKLDLSKVEKYRC